MVDPSQMAGPGGAPGGMPGGTPPVGPAPGPDPMALMALTRLARRRRHPRTKAKGGRKKK